VRKPPIELAPLLDGAGVDTVEAGATPPETAERLDDAVRSGATMLVIADRAAQASDHAAVWLADHPGWLMLDGPPAGVLVIGSAESVALRDLPGVWRRPRVARPAVGAPLLDHDALRRQAAADAQRLEIDRLRAELREQRAWVAAEVERVRDSTSWRLGHRLVRAARLLTFRRDAGTDALAKIAERLRAPSDR
jgi:hypothetical protein